MLAQPGGSALLGHLRWLAGGVAAGYAASAAVSAPFRPPPATPEQRPPASAAAVRVPGGGPQRL